MARPFQFRLKTLFLLTAVVAAWIPAARWYFGLPPKPKLVKVRGTITMDGLPMKGAEITFFNMSGFVDPTFGPGVKSYTGEIDEKGKFTVRIEPGSNDVIITPSAWPRPSGIRSPSWTTPRLVEDGVWTCMLIVPDGGAKDIVWNLVTPVPKK